MSRVYTLLTGLLLSLMALSLQAAQLTAQQTQIDELKAALADLTQNATVTFKGAQDV